MNLDEQIDKAWEQGVERMMTQYFSPVVMPTEPKKAIKALIANQVRESKIELLTKMLRDNHQKPIPEMYALNLLKELRSKQ